MGPKLKAGFTLIELLIVVIIISILASFAIPNFARAVERARWAEAKNLLGTLRSSQIRYKSAHANYTNDIGDLDMEYTRPRYFDFEVMNDSVELAKATRNSMPDPYLLNETYLTITEDGDFIFDPIVPDWLQ